MTGILWHNDTTNENYLWFLDGARVIHRANVLDEDSNPIIVGIPWSVVGVSADGSSFTRPHIVWHDQSSNMTLLWRMFNHKIASRAAVLWEDGSPAFVGPPWNIVGAGDFNGNGKSDILWHNSDSNETQIWFMNDHQIVGRPTVVGEDGSPAFVGPPWNIVGAGDFNGNGKSDILWHNSDSNETQIWFMNDHQVASRGTVLWEDGSPAFVGPPWNIVGAGDFNGNGKSDILWHNSDSNETQIWFMNDHQISSRGTVLAENGTPAFLGPPWRIAGAGDFTQGRVGPIVAAGDPAGGEAVHAESESGWAAVAGYNKNNGPGVWGVGGPGGGEGVHGESRSGWAAVAGYSKGPGAAGWFDGNVVVKGDLILDGADYAEALTTGDSAVVPGSVVVVGQDGELHPCAKDYDSTVVGIVSGAGGSKPAIVLDRNVTGAPIALMGKVWCLADAAVPIRPGDMLTTAVTPGHCRRVTDDTKAFGAVIGKALTPLASGVGLVRVLVSPR